MTQTARRPLSTPKDRNQAGESPGADSPSSDRRNVRSAVINIRFFIIKSNFYLHVNFFGR